MTFRLGEVASIAVMRTEIRDCASKRHHATPAAALQHIESLYATGRRKPAPGSLKSYRCRVCRNGWLVGHRLLRELAS